jgi:hypothetical protein
MQKHSPNSPVAAAIDENEKCANPTCHHRYVTHPNGGHCEFRTFGLNPDRQCSCLKFERQPTKQIKTAKEW